MTRPGRGLFPGEVSGLGHELVGLDECDLRQAAEVGLEAPDALFGVEHRVVVSVGAFEFDGEAVGDDLVAGVPGVHAGAGAQDDSGQVGADDVVGQVVSFRQFAELAVALQEAEGRHRLEDRGPDGVVVDRAGHHGHQGLTGAEFGHRHLIEVERLARVLLAGVETGEHLGLVLVHGHRAVRIGQRQCGDVGGRAVRRLDGVQDVLHGVASGGACCGNAEQVPGGWDMGSRGARGAVEVCRRFGSWWCTATPGGRVGCL